MITRRTWLLLAAAVIATLFLVNMLRSGNGVCVSAIQQKTGQPHLVRVQEDDIPMSSLKVPCEDEESLLAPRHSIPMLCLVLWTAVIVSFGRDVSTWPDRKRKARRRHRRRRPAAPEPPAA